jgi:CrcB protein
MYSIISVGLGGALGAISRFLLSLWFNPKDGFPYGTLFANALGCLLLGFLGIYLASRSTPEWRLFVTTGFLGALTTFSTFSFETLQFGLRAQWKLAIIYLCTQLLSGLLLGLIGIKLAQHYTHS